MPDVNVTDRPDSVLDLLLRIFPRAAEDGGFCRPFRASAVSLNGDGLTAEAVSTIVERVSNSEACLVHRQPLAGTRLEVSVSASDGAVLRIQAEVVSSAHRGPLIETIARFLR
jgi:hypothetical protein